jgi:hypothetical protein
LSAVAEPVDIILLSYNRREYLAQMVTALEERTHWPHRVSVVDNLSGPETRQWLRENAGRFHQVIWNDRNEHLAGFQRGIAATAGALFVLSDADIVVGEPTADGCWLTRLVALADRHPDFGLLGVRLDSVTEARNARLEGAPLVDGEILEAATGVWLNLIRREALRIPYMSDGITGHALRRTGYRVGVAADIYATHLGDADAQTHPDYLARKQRASGWRTTYPRYPELVESSRPPTLAALALAAPLLKAIERSDVSAVVELRAPHAVLAAVHPRIASYGAGEELPRGPAIALASSSADAAVDPALLGQAFAAASEWVFVLAGAAPPLPAAGWTLIGEHAGPDPVVLGLARLASRPRWRRRLLYSTVEHRDAWLALFAASAFGDGGPLRIYAFRRTDPPPAEGWIASATQPPPSPFQPPMRIRRRRLGTLVTKLRRLIRAEWLLFRTRGR